MSGKEDKNRREQDLSVTVQAHQDALLSFVRRLVRDQREADDVIQDVFAEYVIAYDVGEAFDAVGAWLFTVARRKVIDRFRRKKTQNEYIASEVLHNPREKTSAHDPEDESINNLLREQLIDALEQLPEEQRDVFVRHELEGQSFEEISTATGVGVNTLLARKRYAILFLREQLKEIYDELE